MVQYSQLSRERGPINVNDSNQDGLNLCAGLSPNELTAIQELAAACDQYEGLIMRLNWDDLRARPTNVITDFLYYQDGLLIGFLGMYIFNKYETEISGMMHPDYRLNGIFSQLLAAAKDECIRRNFQRLLLMCEKSSPSGQNCLKQIGARYSFTEYKMRLDPTRTIPTSEKQLTLRKAGIEDIKIRAEIFSQCHDRPLDNLEEFYSFADEENSFIYVAELAGEVIGHISASNVDGEIVIFGFGILSAYRGRGYGREILNSFVELLKTIPHTSINLEVASENDRALNLYKSCGFTAYTAYDYYEILLFKE